MIRVGVVLAGLIVPFGLTATSGVAQPVGGPFQVNSFATDFQGVPAVASAPVTGDFVVVWESEGQDGDYSGIFGQRYAATGGKQGTEFPANSFTTGPQSIPDVAVGSDGSFVVVWQGYGPDGDYSDILARRFASNGAPLGGEFQVNAPVAYSYEGAAAVAETASGFVVVWDDYDDVFARRFDGNGTPLDDPFPVNTATLGFQGSADVAATADGGFVIAWEDGYFDGDGEDGSGYGVFARRYDAAGKAAGMPFQVNSTTAGDQYAVSIGAPPDGGFILVWQSYDVDDPSPDAAVLGQRFDGDGAPQGGEFRVNAAPSDAGDDPAVAADQFGNFVVVWSGPPQAGAPSTVLERRFAGAGTPLAGVTPVNLAPTPAPTGAGAEQGVPVVSAATDGRYVVAWERDDGDGSDAAVFAQRFAAIAPTPLPTATLTRTRTPTATATPPSTATGTATATATASAVPSATPTRTVTATHTPSATATRTSTASRTPSPTASGTATRNATPTATDSPPPTATPGTPPAATGTLPPTATALPSSSPTWSATPGATPPPTGAPATATRTAPATDSPSPSLTPTAVATASAFAAPTDSATASPALTATAPIATTTPTMACSGDCNGDGMVAINELVTAVGIALGDRAPDGCRAVDAGGDGHVTIDDLIRAVTRALTGCG